MTVRPLSGALGAAAVLAAGATAPALAQERFSVDASVAAGVASNPFLQQGDTPATGSATVSISPSYRLDQGLTRFAVNGDATFTDYLQRYRNSDSYAVNGSATHQLSERSVLSARLGYLNSVVGAFNDVGLNGRGIDLGTTAPLGTTPAGGAAIVSPVPSPTLGLVSDLAPDLTLDPALGAIGRRRQSYSAGAGFGTGLGARDRLSLDLSVAALRSGGRSVNGVALDDFNTVTQAITYQRTINARLFASANVSVGQTDYLGRRLNDATTIQPTVGGTYRIAADMSLSLGVGVSVVRTDLALAGQSRTSTPFSVQGSLCKQNERFNACLSASRAAMPSYLSGVRVQTAVSLSGGMRLSERGSASVGVSYSRAGQPLSDVTIGNAVVATRTEYLSGQAAYNRTLSRRLSAFVSAGASHADGGVQGRRNASFEARVGVRARFGALR